MGSAGQESAGGAQYGETGGDYETAGGEDYEDNVEHDEI